MKKREPLIFSEQFFRKTHEAVARAVAESAAVGLPKTYLDSYDELPVKPAKTLQDVIFADKFRQGISEGIKEAVASSEAAGLPKSYLDS